MLLYRVFSAIIGIPLALFAVWRGGFLLSAIILVIAILGVLEMGRLWKKVGIRMWIPGAVVGSAFYVVDAHTGGGFLGAALFLTLAAGAVYLISVYPAFSFADMAATIFSPIYTGWLLAHLIDLRQLPGGVHFVLLVLAVTWSTDTFAYFVGINLGKHKLAPVLSPGKSVEGAVGGALGSIIIALAIGLLYNSMPLLHYPVIGLLAGITGQAGDLLESAFKRMSGVKDSGNLIPGHGGILDRFDSLFLTGPVVYYYVKLFIMN